MWSEILAKLHRLRVVDRQFQAFGAETHRYSLRPRLSEQDLVATERRLGVRLPADLRHFYAEVGDGGAGPEYGLRPAAKLTAYRPAEPYPGAAHYRRLAAGGPVPPDDGGYFEIPHSELTGLVAVIDQGCGHETCVVVTGSADPAGGSAAARLGTVVDVSCDGFIADTGKTLPDLYDEWLDRELELFDAVLGLMRSGKTLDQIHGEMLARYDVYDADSRIVSLADVPKPAALFGEGGRRIHHGATQRPWVGQVLEDWQRRNLR
jgi:hypothetical protein